MVPGGSAGDRARAFRVVRAIIRGLAVRTPDRARRWHCGPHDLVRDLSRDRSAPKRALPGGRKNSPL